METLVINGFELTWLEHIEKYVLINKSMNYRDEFRTLARAIRKMAELERQ